MIISRIGSPLCLVALLALTSAAAGQSTSASKVAPAKCPRCGWSAPPIKPKATVVVSGIDDLERALERARPDMTILLNDGTYRLRRSLIVNVPGVVLQSRNRDPKRVSIVGAGMVEDTIGVALSIEASRVILADFTVGRVKFHGVQVRGERQADRLVMHNLRVIDTGQQFLKGSAGPDGRGPHEGLVSCSEFSFTKACSNDYTNAIDVIGGSKWVLRRNKFLRIRGPESQGWICGPTILMWGGCRDTLVEQNLLVDCYRGIALGLVEKSSKGGINDHSGGIVRYNVVCNLHEWADESIEANDCPGVVIEANTVLSEGKVGWSIGVRYPRTTAVIRDNLTNRPLFTRDQGQFTEQGNITKAQRGWFQDPARGDLKPVRKGLEAVGAWAVLPGRPGLDEKTAPNPATTPARERP